MKKSITAFLALGALAFGAQAAESRPETLGSGIDLQYVDRSVRPQDDLFRHLAGGWLAGDVIPADRARYGSFDALADATEKQVKAIVDELAARQDLAAGSDERKIADLYASFMDEKALERRGTSALRAELAKITALTGKGQLAAVFADLQALGVAQPLGFFINPDARNSTRYVVYLEQGGLGLPDRDYYLKDDARLKEARLAYLGHVQRMLTLAGVSDAKAEAERIVELETAIARAQWTKVESRDAIRSYNKIAVKGLAALGAGFDWPAYLGAAGVGDKVKELIVRQPSYVKGLAKLIDETPLSTWQAYLQWHVIAALAPYLGEDFVTASFDFYGRTLRGIPEDRPRWKRGLALIDESLGEALGRSYVARHFPQQNKLRMESLVANLIGAYRQSITGLDWMGPKTRQQALAKLAKITVKIGYPSRWRDYGALAIERDDLVGNVVRARRFEAQRQVAKLGHPIDRSEWEMTPQTVNAYYNPEMNEIVFPAAILQPPFFDVSADDAANYGAIGAVIGHEISHGFDDQGSHYDGNGNLRDWWTPADHAKFNAKAKALVAQYSAYSPVAGYNVNGELTLGENIADTSGLAIAYKAYGISLAGKPAPLIDGLSGDQRFCLGFAQVWRSKSRDAEAVRRIKSDPHSPPEFRANGTLSNNDAFYRAFAVQPGDKLYRSPAERVRIW